MRIGAIVMAHTFTNLLTHLIFSTKDRRPWLDGESRPRVFAYIGGIVREMNGTALIVNGVADHVHLLVATPPTLSTSDAMRVVKTNSSKWIHDTFPHLAEFAWQTGYGAFSVSRSNASAVEKYIAGQEEHHRHVTFQDEFVAFLKRHGIQFDSKYIWE